MHCECFYCIKKNNKLILLALYNHSAGPFVFICHTFQFLNFYEANTETQAHIGKREVGRRHPSKIRNEAIIFLHLSVPIQDQQFTSKESIHHCKGKQRGTEATISKNS